MEYASHSLSAEQKPPEGEDAGATKAEFDDMLHFAFEDAVAKGDKSSFLARLGVGVEFEGALNLAVERGHNEIATAILERGAPATGCVDGFEESPLYVAATQGNTEMLNLLLEKGANIDHMNFRSSNEGTGTALFAATELGHLPAVQLLLEKGADPSIRSLREQSPLDKAAENGDKAVLKTLLAFGADATDTREEGISPLHSASRKTVVNLLVAAGADVDARADDGGFTPLMCALGRQRVSPRAASALLRHGAAVNCQDDNGNSALHYAASTGIPPLVDLLLRSGADETMVNNKGEKAADRVGTRNPGCWPRALSDCVRKLLNNAPADRTWRRKGLLLLCVARHGGDHPLSAERVNVQDGWTRTADWLLGLRLGAPDIFRTIVGYL